MRANVLAELAKSGANTEMLEKLARRMFAAHLIKSVGIMLTGSELDAFISNGTFPGDIGVEVPDIGAIVDEAFAMAGLSVPNMTTNNTTTNNQ